MVKTVCGFFSVLPAEVRLMVVYRGDEKKVWSSHRAFVVGQPDSLGEI